MGKTDNYHISVLANQLLTPKLASGGDVLSFEVLSNFKNINLDIYAPDQAETDIKSKLSNVKYHSTDDSNLYLGANLIGGLAIFWRYLFRTITCTSLLLKNKQSPNIYLTGDFFCNSIPAVIYKIVHPETKIFCNFYHLNPVPWKRENNYLYSLISWLLQHFSLFILKPFTDKFFVLTQEGERALDDLGVRKNKILISGAGVNSDFYKIKATGNYSHCIILFVGRLNKTKGIYDALHCLEIIKKGFPDIKLGVVGACSKAGLKNIKDKLKKSRLNNNFHYFGYVSNKEKIKLMKTTPILIAPSYEEGFGIGVLEGIAAGMKIAAYNLPVYPLIFNKYKSKIKYAPVGDIEALSKILIQLIKNKDGNQSVNVPTWEKIARIQIKTINSTLLTNEIFIT